MRTIVLISLVIPFVLVSLALIGKIIGKIPHVFEFKVDKTHENEED